MYIVLNGMTTGIILLGGLAWWQWQRGQARSEPFLQSEPQPSALEKKVELLETQIQQLQRSLYGRPMY